MTLLFGTAGVPLSAQERSTEAGIHRVRELGLDAMEVEFVHGVRMKAEKAAAVAKVAQAEHIALSCHAPYYINLNSAEKEKVIASKQRILETARIADILGAESIIFHPAFYGKDNADDVFRKVLQEVAEIRTALEDSGSRVVLRPETTGKPTQFGSLEETIRLAAEIDGVLPCIDFSHLYARSTGAYNTYDEICYVLEETAEKLGDRWVSNAHFHLSGIEYGAKGERRHLTFEESGLNYREILSALLSFGIQGTVICESPNLETDTLMLQQTYTQLR